AKTGRRSARRWPKRSGEKAKKPVTLPPGRARLTAMPVASGSPIAPATTGITEVACFAAMVAGVPQVTMTLTLRWTNSAAISAKRSSCPSAHRYSMTMLRPSIQPSSRSRCTRAAIHWLSAERVLAPKNPIVFAGCCARAASGHAAAAQPIAAINSRRLIVTGIGPFHARVAKRIERYHAAHLSSSHLGAKLRCYDGARRPPRARDASWPAGYGSVERTGVFGAGQGSSRRRIFIRGAVFFGIVVDDDRSATGINASIALGAECSLLISAMAVPRRRHRHFGNGQQARGGLSRSRASLAGRARS